MVSRSAPLTTTLPLEAATHMASRKIAPIERFMQKVHQDESGCWLWTASRMSTGYGGFRLYGVAKVGAHRAAWMLMVGEIPSGIHVCHKCDVRLCVNPAHLFLGTCQDNSDDRVAKGRQAKGESFRLATQATRARGNRHGRSKVTAHQVEEIRNIYSSAPRGQRVKRGTVADLSIRYGLHKTTIMRIVRWQTWNTD